MTWPSRLSRESTTRSSSPPQKGHFMPLGTRDAGLGTRRPRGYCPSFRGQLFRFRHPSEVELLRVDHQQDQADGSDEHEGGRHATRATDVAAARSTPKTSISAICTATW